MYIYHQIQSQQAADEARKLKDEQDQFATEIAEIKKSNSNVHIDIAPTNMRNVLYATEPVEPGMRISTAVYEKKMTPVQILPDAFTDKNDIVGWVAIRKIERGDPLTPRNIGKTLPYLSQRISPGMRMISLLVFNASANTTGGFVVDGDHVDLLYTSGGVTQLALQNVRVAYVPGTPMRSDQTEGIAPAPAPDERLAVTFEVQPEVAQVLANLSASNAGSFSMILRNRSDHQEIKVKPFSVADLQGDFRKLQRISDQSDKHVQAIADAIAAEEKKNQGTPNETTPTPSPTP